MSPLTANMCYYVVWARYGRDLGQINPLKPWGHTETLFGLDMGGTWARFMSTMCYYVVWARYGRDLPFEPCECPLSRLICVIPLFGIDMGVTWAKSIPSGHGVTLKPKLRGLPFEPWSVPSRAFYV